MAWSNVTVVGKRRREKFASFKCSVFREEVISDRCFVAPAVLGGAVPCALWEEL